MEKAGQRRRRYYRLTKEGRSMLAQQRRGWERFVAAIARTGTCVMRDWKATVTAHLAERQIDPTLHVSTLDELAAHLDELNRSRVDSRMIPRRPTEASWRN